MKELKFYIAFILLLSYYQLTHSFPQADVTDVETNPEPDCTCISSSSCLVEVEEGTNAECLADEICCPNEQISDESLLAMLAEGEAEECSCTTAALCEEMFGTVSTSPNTCTGAQICCENAIDLGAILPELANETSCKCVVADQCLQVNAQVLDCPAEGTVCCPEEEIRDLAPAPITDIQPSSLPETCACTEETACTAPTGLSALVHVRSRSPHRCVGTQICCPIPQPSESPEQAGCTCTAEKFCSATAGQLIDPAPFGFECSNNQVCCPNERVQIEPVGSCVCVPTFRCEDAPDAPVHPHNEFLRCAEPLVCCAKPKLDESPPKCGLSFKDKFGINVRIGAGFTAKFSEFPWMVAITELKNTGDEAYLCGGSLIHPSVVLTSAECVEKRAGSILNVRAGDWDLESITEDRPYVERQVNEVKLNPGWSAESLNNNLALLYLSSEIPLQGHINTVCLPNDTTSFNSGCSLSGWGTSKFGGRYHTTLKKVNLPLIPNENCQDMLRQTRRLGNEFALDPSNVCAGATLGDACTGDGGSPLTCTLEDGSNREVQVGVVSWGLKCGQRDVPGVYASTANAFTWIRDTVTQDFGPEAVSFFT